VSMCHFGPVIVIDGSIITVTRALIVPALQCRAQAEILVKQEASTLWSVIPLPMSVLSWKAGMEFTRRTML
jgi:hypothetical protein